MLFNSTGWRMVFLAVLMLILSGCEITADVESASGVQMAEVEVTTGSSGLTVEQENVRDRLLMDNTPGSIKHLYIISAWSGDVLIYSTVRGKVTSSGKRLTPTSVANDRSDIRDMVSVNIGDNSYRTGEVLQDDGTYGSSIPYLFWWDAQGRYHQHYVSGGQILHVSNQPIAVGDVRINMSVDNEQ